MVSMISHRFDFDSPSLFVSQEIRVVVRELDTTGREILLILQQIHQEDGLNKSRLCYHVVMLKSFTMHVNFLFL